MNTPAVNPALLKWVRLFVQHRAALGELQRLQSTRDDWIRQRRDLEQRLAELRQSTIMSPHAHAHSMAEIQRFQRRHEQDIAKHEGALALVTAAIDLLQARIVDAETRSKSNSASFYALRSHLKNELEALGVDLR